MPHDKRESQLEQLNASLQIDLQQLKPENSEQSLVRSIFYSHCLHSYCRQQIDLLLNRVTAGEFAPGLKEVIEPGISDWNLDLAVKMLTTISIHMVGLDTCSESGPDWLVEFVFEALRETDEIFPDPSAADILEKHGSWKREQIADDVAKQCCHHLGFIVNADEPVAVLRRFLIESAPLRAELLVFALSQPFEALGRHLQQFDNQ